MRFLDINSDGLTDIVAVRAPVTGATTIMLRLADGGYEGPFSLPGFTTGFRRLPFLGGKDRFIIRHGNGGYSLVSDWDGGAFTNVEAFPNNWSGLDVGVGDFNGDGLSDFVLDGVPNIHLQLGLADGGFSSEAFDAGLYANYSITVGDLDGDGIDDLIVATLSSPFGQADSLRLFGSRSGVLSGVDRHLGDVDFVSRPAVPFLDLNQDGFPDVVWNREVLLGDAGQEGKFYYELGAPDGGSRPLVAVGVTPPELMARFEDVLVGDLDGDGRPDVLMTAALPDAGVVRESYAVGDAGLKLARTLFTPAVVEVFELYDVDGDGVQDLVVAVDGWPTYAIGWIKGPCY